MKRYILLTLIIVAAGLSVPIELLFSESYPTAQGGLNSVYFKEFFTRSQPKQYYDFPDFSQRVFYPDASEIYLHYQVVDDFNKPNTWGIISPSEQFTKTETDTTTPGDTDLLHWRTFQKSDVNYTLLPPVDRGKTLRQTPPSIMGVRSLFLTNGNKVIKIYPKENLFLPSYDIHFIEFWIFSLHVPYDVYITLQDYKGMLHKLYAGDMQYYGWKRLRATFDLFKLGGVRPSLLYTRAVQTRLKINSITFESQNSIDTDGFFGAWLGDLGVVFSPRFRIPDSISSPAAKLGTSFDWNEPDQGMPAPAEEEVATSAGQ